MNQSQFIGLVRHLVAAAGVILAATGVGGADLVDQISGAVLTVAAIGWSLWEKRGK